jgi:hypothetical protein
MERQPWRLPLCKTHHGGEGEGAVRSARKYWMTVLNVFCGVAHCFA